MGLDIEAFELQGAGLGGVKDVRPDGGHLEALPIDDRIFPSGVLPLNGFSPGSGQIRKGVAPDVDGIEPVVDAVLNPDGLTEEDGPLVRLDDRLELGGSGRLRSPSAATRKVMGRVSRMSLPDLNRRAGMRMTPTVEATAV